MCKGVITVEQGGKHDNSSSRNGTEEEEEEIATYNENFAKKVAQSESS